MGLFSFLFGKDKAKQNKKKVQTATNTDLPVVKSAAGLSNELIAVISAAAYAMLTTEYGQTAFKITRISNAWVTAGRQQVMDSHRVRKS